ncbi:hypothetical protein DRQ26_02680 [bacterium]|nr:MAG: hypothetical protein DRQ26_02680 [bacterium]
MKKTIIAVMIFLQSAIFSQSLPVFLKADSLRVSKILRAQGDTSVQTDFIQQLQLSCVETAIVVDTLCGQDTCYASRVETIRVILSKGDTARVPVEDDTIAIVGTDKNVRYLNIPAIDPDPNIDGDEIFIWSSRAENFCDTSYLSDRQTVLCQYCGVRRVFEFWYPESIETAVLLHHLMKVSYPADDSCAEYYSKQNDESSPLFRFQIMEKNAPVRISSDGDEIPVSNVVENIIPDARKSPLLSDVLFNVRFNPESLVTAPGNDTVIIPIAAIDGSWIVRWKWLWDFLMEFNEDYTGYVPYWDEIPWGEADFRDEGILQFALAAPAQYYPTYAGDTLGSVDSIIALLEDAGIADDSLYLCYPADDGAVWGWYKIREIFYKGFSTDSEHCAIVFSRPMDTLFTHCGNICDNSHKAFFCEEDIICDSTSGLRATGEYYYRGLWADALHFYSGFDIRTLCDIGVIPYSVEQVRNAAPKLVVYVIGAGSVPRMWLNGEEIILSPEYFPSYGDPYGYVYNGYDTTITSPPLEWDDLNEVEIEHIAPLSDEIGAQVILALKFAAPETTEYIEPVRVGDEIMINAPIFRGTAVADSGQSADTADVQGVDSTSAAIVMQKVDGMWQGASFSLESGRIIINFEDTIDSDRRWRWWFFSGSE